MILYLYIISDALDVNPDSKIPLAPRRGRRMCLTWAIHGLPLMEHTGVGNNFAHGAHVFRYSKHQHRTHMKPMCVCNMYCTWWTHVRFRVATGLAEKNPWLSPDISLTANTNSSPCRNIYPEVIFCNPKLHRIHIIHQQVLYYSGLENRSAQKMFSTQWKLLLSWLNIMQNMKTISEKNIGELYLNEDIISDFVLVQRSFPKRWKLCIDRDHKRNSVTIPLLW